MNDDVKSADDYFAVVFTSQQSGRGTEAYAKMAETMEQLAREQPGFLGIESARSPDGFGITVSYWRDEAAIAAWKANAEHQIAQNRGKQEWYRHYRLRIARVEREYGFSRSGSDSLDSSSS